MQIRLATQADLDTLVQFQCNMALETEALRLDADVLRAGINALLLDTTKGRYYVATEAGAVIACLSITYEWSDWRNGTVWWIQSVYVSKEHRGREVYGTMYRYLQEEVSKRADIKGIRLYVDKRNPKAAAVYERYGMNGEHYQLYEWMPE